MLRKRASDPDRSLDRLEQSLKLMIQAARPSRSDARELRRWRVEAAHSQARTRRNLAKITRKLDALAEIVDKSIRRHGGRRQQ